MKAKKWSFQPFKKFEKNSSPDHKEKCSTSIKVAR